MVTRIAVVAALAGACATPSVLAQSAPTATFEVASIRPAASGARMAHRVVPGRVDLINTPLRSLLTLAFGIQPTQLDGPDWMANTRFDVQATMPAAAGREQVPQMLRHLLAERFGLVARVEQRLVDGYELVVGGGGFRMREVQAVDDVAKDFGNAPSDTTSETLDGPVRTMMIPLGMRTVTSRSLYSTWTAAGGTFHVQAERISMPELARILALNVDRPVIDRTGLNGVYTFQIELDRNASALRVLRSTGVTTRPDGSPIEGAPTGVSTFRAIEGLGLRLEERRVPLDFVVVERIARTPTLN